MIRSVRFAEGIQCKKCGDFIAPICRKTSVLCQGCGAKIIEGMDLAHSEFIPAKNGEVVTVKITSHIFSETLEIVD